METENGWRLVEPKFDATYRIQGLPGGCNEIVLKSAIDAAFSLKDESSSVHVHSLAPSADHKCEKTATVTAMGLSRILKGPKNQWIFDVPSQALTSPSDDCSIAPVVIDTHFQSFTTLFAPPSDEHAIEYVSGA